MIILQVLLGIVTIVLYIILRAQLLNETRSIYKAGYFAVGLGVFAMIWATAWHNQDDNEIGIFEIPVGATIYINHKRREVVSTDIKYLGLLEE